VTPVESVPEHGEHGEMPHGGEPNVRAIRTLFTTPTFSGHVIIQIHQPWRDSESDEIATHLRPIMEWNALVYNGKSNRGHHAQAAQGTKRSSPNADASHLERLLGEAAVGHSPTTALERRKSVAKFNVCSKCGVVLIGASLVVVPMTDMYANTKGGGETTVVATLADVHGQHEDTPTESSANFALFASRIVVQTSASVSAPLRPEDLTLLSRRLRFYRVGE
jgi:hypothetical protein